MVVWELDLSLRFAWPGPFKNIRSLHMRFARPGPNETYMDAFYPTRVTPNVHAFLDTPGPPQTHAGLFFGPP